MPRKSRLRRREYGSITEVVRGKKYIVRWWAETEKGYRRRSKTIYGTRDDAARFTAERHIENGRDHRMPTWREAFNLWYIPSQEARVESGAILRKTADDNYKLFHRVIEPRFGSMPIDVRNIVSDQKWLMTLAPGTASSALSILRKIVDEARKHIDVPSTGFDRGIKYELPKKKVREKSRETYTMDECTRILALLHGVDMLEAPFIIAAFGGARVTEAAAVKAEEVSRVEHAGITAALFPIERHTLSRGYETTDDGRLKNAQSVRFTLVVGEPAERLLEICEQRKRDGIEWLCDRGDGLPLNGQMLKYYWNTFMEREAGETPIPFSNIRKSWRTFMEVDLKLQHNMLERLMGHKIPGVTGQHYYVLKEEMAVKAVCEAYARFQDS